MDPRIRITLRLLAENDPADDPNIAQASELLGLSESYLMRLFHREVGKTVRQHFLDLRMAKAALLLQDFAKPIKQIAIDCGYSDISNFYRDFKGFHAITPKGLRLRAMAAIKTYVANSDSRFSTR